MHKSDVMNKYDMIDRSVEIPLNEKLFAEVKIIFSNYLEKIFVVKLPNDTQYLKKFTNEQIILMLKLCIFI